MRLTLASVASGLIAATSIAAQTPPGLVELTRSIPLVVRQDTNTCAQVRCQPAGFPPAVAQFAGGTAYDPRTRGVWISEGLSIAKVDVRNQCVYQCPPIPMPNTTPNNVVTGLALNEIADILFVTDASGIIRWYSTAGCVPMLLSRCIAPIPNGWVLTGCATDDTTKTLFYSAVDPAQPGGIVYVASQGDPCNPYCKLQIQSCGGGPIGPLTGLGFDACRSALWTTDGKQVVGGRLTYGPAIGCQFVEFQCCPNMSGDPIVGLDVMPGDERRLGRPCMGNACPSCPTLNHVLSGDPTLGNPSFSLDLVDAPANSPAYMIFNVGPCTAPGLTFGLFCGPILVPFVTPPIVLGPIPTGGAAGCTGSASVAFPLPIDRSLCGIVCSSQYVGLCRSPIGIDTFVSPCLSWAIAGP